MGGDGYSDRLEFQVFFNCAITATKFGYMNSHIGRKINMFVVGRPNTDVPSDFTNGAKMISDELFMVLQNYFKESAMEEPPEFVHYKLPHFTPQHLEMLQSMKMALIKQYKVVA